MLARIDQAGVPLGLPALFSYSHRLAVVPYENGSHRHLKIQAFNSTTVDSSLVKPLLLPCSYIYRILLSESFDLHRGVIETERADRATLLIFQPFGPLSPSLNRSNTFCSTFWACRSPSSSFSLNLNLLQEPWTD